MLALAAAPLARLQQHVQAWAGEEEPVHLLGVDGYGVTFRVLRGYGSYDLRVPFAARVRSAAAVPEAVRRLTTCPRSPA